MSETKASDVLWYNDGTAALNPITNDAKMWLKQVGSTRGSDVVDTDEDQATLFVIPTHGADSLQLQWNSIVTAEGSLAGNTPAGTGNGSGVFVVAHGIPWLENDPDLQPAIHTGVLSDFSDNDHRTLSNSLGAKAWDVREAALAHCWQEIPVLSEAGLFYEGVQINDNVKCGWNIDIYGRQWTTALGADPSANPQIPAADAGIADFKLSHCHMVGLRIALFNTLGGTTYTDVSIKGRLRAVLGHEGIYQPEFQRALRGG